MKIGVVKTVNLKLYGGEDNDESQRVYIVSSQGTFTEGL